VRKTPLGQQVHMALIRTGAQSAKAVAEAAGQPDLFDRVNAVAVEDPLPSFLHSALCAMSLPVRRPNDETAPILRHDGQYTLAITPKPVLQLVGGQQKLVALGVPYGALPRLILIHVMTEAVRTRSRQIHLGASFTDWMRRLGYKTISYGPRGSATLVKHQLDRLLACEWMIRWDGEQTNGVRDFGIKEIKLTTEYVGSDDGTRSFMREIRLTEGFFEHLREHAVPLNEHAIRQLHESPTALDLYTWLAYRLPRISPRRPATLTWQQLAVHFGNDGNNIRKFRQTIRDAWDRQVSAVYPEARAEFDTTTIRLHCSPAPLRQTTIAVPRLQLVTPPPEASAAPPAPLDLSAAFLKCLRDQVGEAAARAWLRDASLDMVEPLPRLVVPTRFQADWVRSHFAQAIAAAAKAASLEHSPQVVARAQ
jgi:hypothetical protein